MSAVDGPHRSRIAGLPRAVDAQVTPAMPDSPADEQSAQQSQLVQGGTARSDVPGTVRPDGSVAYRGGIPGCGTLSHGTRVT